ncbi:MAG: hypothetical protein U0610_23950 [bacterium]
MATAPSAPARQFFLADTLHWVPAQGLEGVQEIGLAKRVPDGPEEIVGYDKVIEGQNYLYAQRKCRVTKAFNDGLVGITYELKEDYWWRNCVPATELKPIPEKKPKRPPPAKAPAAPKPPAAPEAAAEPAAAPPPPSEASST